MNRAARTLRRSIEQRVESFTGKSDFAAGLGIGTFVFLMVVREGAEMVVILRAVELSSEGLAVWIGTGLGLAISRELATAQQGALAASLEGGTLVVRLDLPTAAHPTDMKSSPGRSPVQQGLRREARA